MQRWVSRTFWSTHKDPEVVRNEVERLLGELENGQLALNVGSGESDLDPSLVNLDLTPDDATDCVADARSLPFEGKAFSNRSPSAG